MAGACFFLMMKEIGHIQSLFYLLQEKTVRSVCMVTMVILPMEDAVAVSQIDVSNKLTINTTKQNTESGQETLEHYLNTIPVILKLM